MEYVIVMLLANALGQPVAIGTYAGAKYPDLASCDAARPGVVEQVQKEVDRNRPGDKVVDSKCATQDAVNKVNDKVRRPPLEGQRDARISD